MNHVTVIGAGLAGLAAATRLAEAGCEVSLYEASPQAGGRCRSYFDANLGLTLDNGNHLVLAGNRAVHTYLRRIGGQARLTGPAEARYPWIDLRTGERWTIRPNAGRIPWWLLAPSRRVPGTRPKDYLALARLARARPGQTVADVIATTGPLWERLLHPFLVSALNTPPETASASLAGAIISESLALGGAASAPRIAIPTLAAAFVQPALAYLTARGAHVHFGSRLRAITLAGLDFGSGPQPVHGPVVLAVPAWVAIDLVPGLPVPTQHHAIVNAHFACAPPMCVEPITGCVGGTVEWVFTHPDRISVTVSAADRFLDADRAKLAETLWAETKVALAMGAQSLPPNRIVMEKRATFSATCAQDALRPLTRTRIPGLFLAGDWTQTKLPSTIEGAIRSGYDAATLALGWKAS